MHPQESYEAFDASQIESLSLLLDRQLYNASIQQSVLPVKKGGAGLRFAEQHCATTFIASTSLPRHIQKLQSVPIPSSAFSIHCPQVSKQNKPDQISSKTNFRDKWWFDTKLKWVCGINKWINTCNNSLAHEFTIVQISTGPIVGHTVQHILCGFE